MSPYYVINFHHCVIKVVAVLFMESLTLAGSEWSSSYFNPREIAPPPVSTKYVAGWAPEPV